MDCCLSGLGLNGRLRFLAESSTGIGYHCDSNEVAGVLSSVLELTELDGPPPGSECVPSLAVEGVFGTGDSCGKSKSSESLSSGSTDPCDISSCVCESEERCWSSDNSAANADAPVCPCSMGASHLKI